jgi:hypothetical protein
MSIDLQPLMSRAFYDEKVGRTATESLERVGNEFARRTNQEGFHYEVVVPQVPDEEWVRERLLHPLVYFCDSRGSPIPQCPGVYLAMFVGDRLYGISAADMLVWASETFNLSPDELERQYGTHEVGIGLR